MADRLKSLDRKRTDLCKKLGLNLVSEPGESGCVSCIIDDITSAAKADRVKQAA
jgi:hypothetical protein